MYTNVVGPECEEAIEVDIIWQVDLQFSTLGGPGAFFRWCNVYYWLQDESIPIPNATIVNRWQLIGISTPSTHGTYEGRRIRQVSHYGYDVSLSTPQPGQRPVVGAVLPASCLYLWGRSEGRRVTYHRLKGPDGYSASDGPFWSSAVIDWVNSFIVARLNLTPVCNGQGVPVTEWEIDPRVQRWQWRHGTIRRERSIV